VASRHEVTRTETVQELAAGTGCATGLTDNAGRLPLTGDGRDQRLAVNGKTGSLTPKKSSYAQFNCSF